MLLINPPSWRRTDHKLQKTFSKLNLHYLELHDNKDGVKTFNCDTRYDWYVLQNSNTNVITKVKMIDGTTEAIDIKRVNFIPNKNLKPINSLIAKQNEEKCSVLFSYSNYETRKEWMSEKQNEKYRYPCIHMTRRSGDKIYYSSRRDNGMFGVSKIIFGDRASTNGIISPFIDINGEYGQTQHAISVEVSEIDVDNVYKALTSRKFNEEIIDSIKWCGFQLDFRIFKYFKKNWWREFV